MTRYTAFTPAGQTDGIPLVQHQCERFGVAYVSAEPSPPGDPFVVPMCGCRPQDDAEDAEDVAEADAAMAGPGDSTPWEQVKTELGL